MRNTATLSCSCREVRGLVSDVAPNTVNRVICYCDDCQAFLHKIERADLLDGQGGTDIVQFAPASVSFVQSIRPLAGTARLVALSLLLTGCAALETGVGPPSLKDARAPSANALTARPAPLMKASNVHSGAPAAPVSRGGGAGCGDQECLDRLKALLEDRERKWIGQPQSPKDHADGTRQFAYRALRGRLTCNELTLAMDEIAKAIRAFAAPVAGVASDQVARVWALDGQV